MFAKLQSWYRSTFGQALTGAALYWAALPPLGLWPLAWIAPVWWVLLIRRNELSGKRPYRTLWLVGFIFWMVTMQWLRLPHWATSFGWVAMSLYLAFYLPLFIGIARVAVHRLHVPLILAAPVAWTGLELARAYVLTGMTMASLGHTQYQWITLIQISDLSGVLGVGFVMMFVSACLARMLPEPGTGSFFGHFWPKKVPVPFLPAFAYWPIVPALALMIATLTYGQHRLDEQNSESCVRIALIQGSIDTELKSDPNKRTEIFRHYFELSKTVADKDQLDLIVWPETMFRETLVCFDQGANPPKNCGLSRKEFLERLELISQSTKNSIALTVKALKAPMILGIDTARYKSDGIDCYNSAILVDRQGNVTDRYDKIHLVMFGEYVPFSHCFPWLLRLTPLNTSLRAGTQPNAFDVNGLKFVPSICYETVLSRVIRRQVNKLHAQGQKADVLINLTNDGWFWGSSELDLHMICGVFRAVECRMPLLIAANTGFSAWIDGSGRIVEQGPRRATGTIIANVCTDRRLSWYLAHGDVLPGICLILCTLWATIGCCLSIRVSSWHTFMWRSHR